MNEYILWSLVVAVVIMWIDLSRKRDCIEELQSAVAYMQAQQDPEREWREEVAAMQAISYETGGKFTPEQEAAHEKLRKAKVCRLEGYPG